MKPSVKLSICLGLLLVGGRAGWGAEEATPPRPGEGPLHNYVKEPDASYRWVTRQEGTVGKSKWVELILTSQSWKNTVWNHQLFVIRPSEIENESQAIMLIDGGRWTDDLAKPPEAGKGGKLTQEAAILAQVAERVKSPVAVLKQVPNQPIFDGLTEDGAISYTFEQFLNTGDPTWPLLLPMVKARCGRWTRFRNSPPRNGRSRSRTSRSPAPRNAAGQRG